MKAIRLRVGGLAVGSGLGLLVSLFILGSALLARGDSYFYCFLLSGLVTVLLVIFTIREYRHYSVAQLIVESQILRIQGRVVEEGSLFKGQDHSAAENRDVTISCFGILVDSKVMRFNMDHIELKRVEISTDVIRLAFGQAHWTETVIILPESIDKQVIQDTSKRFQYETGVVPLTRHQ